MGRSGPEGKPFRIPKQLVWEAYRRVKASKGAAGVDGERLRTLEELLQQVSRDVVLIVVADQEPGQRGTGLMCNTCRGRGE